MILILLFGTIGHAFLWTTILNKAYSQPIPKAILRLWRILTGLGILLFPVIFWLYREEHSFGLMNDCWDVYVAISLIMGLGYWYFTLRRLLRPTAVAVLSENHSTLALAPSIPRKELLGSGKHRWLAALPGNEILNLTISHYELKLERLPKECEGVTITLLSDLHFHGTPSKLWFDTVIEQLNDFPPADLVLLAGDYLDSDEHLGWIQEILGKLRWAHACLAVLGNHDQHHHPEQIREALRELGMIVLGNARHQVPVRGVPWEVIGHEGPWFRPPPPSQRDRKHFQLMVSHSPDQFYWGVHHDVDLIVAGHVHGGAIRLPIIGSMFVPSWYGRRFDMGIFQQDQTVMVVSRGLSGKEPIRWNCSPQIVRLTLRTGHESQ